MNIIQFVFLNIDIQKAAKKFSELQFWKLNIMTLGHLNFMHNSICKQLYFETE